MHLLFHGFCGSGTQVQLSWAHRLRVFHEAATRYQLMQQSVTLGLNLSAGICFQAHSRPCRQDLVPPGLLD